MNNAYRKLTRTSFLSLAVVFDRESGEVGLVDEANNKRLIGIMISDDPEGLLLEHIGYMLDRECFENYSQGREDGFNDGFQTKSHEVADTLRKLIGVSEV